MRNFRQWEVYTGGMDFVDNVYEFTCNLPPEERYGITSQIRRASVSIVNNIAEGAAKYSEKDFIRFLQYSLGSAFECETLLEICRRRTFIDTPLYESLFDAITILEKQLNALIQRIKKDMKTYRLERRL